MNNSCVRKTGLRLIVFLLVSLFLFCSLTGILAFADPVDDPGNGEGSDLPSGAPEVIIPSAPLDGLLDGVLDEAPAGPTGSLTIKFELEESSGSAPSPEDEDAEFVVLIKQGAQVFYCAAKPGDSITYNLEPGEYTIEYFCAVSGYALGEFYDGADAPLAREFVPPPVDPTEPVLPEEMIPRLVTVGTDTVVKAVFQRGPATFRFSLVASGDIPIESLNMTFSGLGLGAQEALADDPIEQGNLPVSPEPSVSPSSTPTPTPSAPPSSTPPSTSTPKPSAPPSSTTTPEPSTITPTPESPAPTQSPESPAPTQSPDDDTPSPEPDAATPTPGTDTPEPDTSVSGESEAEPEE